jgi:ribonucleoside-diphosphate reductase alpha chain
MKTAVAGAVVPNGRLHTRPESVIKRDGSVVPYDRERIARAVTRCLVNDCGETQTEAEQFANHLAEIVESNLFGIVSLSVEKVQDLVEKQLMDQGRHDAAKAYILYREERRKEREARRAVDPATVELFRGVDKMFPGVNGHLQTAQAFDKFCRFDWSKGRREVWPEPVDRVMAYTRKHMDEKHPGVVDEATWAELRDGLVKLEAAPSMRLIQMAGPALERCQVGVYNCAFLFPDSPKSLSEDLYCLMQGTGVGFSVEYRHAVDKWPRVKKQKGHKPDKYVIPDHTEGWCETVDAGVTRWLDGGDYDFDDSNVRRAGSILRTKGGRSSGPQPLRDLLGLMRARIMSRAGDRLTSLDLHDMLCMQHRIVQMGGVRRASGISYSDRDDTLMRDAKNGPFWNAHPYRNQANDSAVYDEKPSAVEFMEEWLSLAKSGSGERGIFNYGSLRKQMPKRRKRVLMRGNPCGEINLRHKQLCNLSIAILRLGLSLQEVRRRVRLAAIWGTILSTMTRFKYIDDLWRQNCEEERLLGVDLLGHLDCELTRPGAPGLEAFLQQLRQDAVDVNLEWSQKLGINQSAAVTCGKPAGDSSCFFDTAAGFKAHHGRFYIRRLRFTQDNPVSRVLVDSGVPYAPDYDKSGLLVFDFPCRAPENAIVLGDQDAVAQLEHWKTFKVHFTEHNPSVTIYVKPDEWLRVGHWVYENWDYVGGLSFLPFDGGVYPLAPYEAISEEEYNQRRGAFPDVDWSLLPAYESEDMTELAQQFACTGGSCAL